MKLLRLILLPAFLLMVTGCLTYSKVLYEIEFDDKLEAGKIKITYFDIRSSEENTEKQKSDFTELVQILEADDFLLDAMEDGIYIRNRTLIENDGQLNGTYDGIFRKLKIDSQEIKTSKNERTLTLKKEDGYLVETNGNILESEDSYLISWPREQRRLVFSITISNNDKTYSLLDYYKSYKTGK